MLGVTGFTPVIFLALAANLAHSASSLRPSSAAAAYSQSRSFLGAVAVPHPPETPQHSAPALSSGVHQLAGV